MNISEIKHHESMQIETVIEKGTERYCSTLTGDRRGRIRSLAS